MPLGEEFLILALIFGILIGSISAVVGIGGGILFIPTSIFIFGFPLKEAVVISLFSMTGLNISASLRYMKMRLINYRLSIIYNLWDLPGVIVGAWITTVITQNILSGICGTLIVVLSIILFRRNNKEHHEITSNPDSHNEGKTDSNKKLKRKKVLGVSNPVIASFSSFSGGFISGLGGLGGGTADTTTMILLGINPKEAAATSQFAMVFTSVSGVIIHIFFGSYNGSILWPIIMTLGGIIGAQIGTYLSMKSETNIIRKLLAVFAFYTGILLILLMFEIGWF
ncbi:MAG: sulfite exporter TauE/SafE family protein [Candidatus Hermodarchaeota archaeon]